MATVPRTASAAVDHPARDSGQRFLLLDVGWETYQSLRAAIGDRPVHITYDRGRLELMVPSDLHERFKKLIDRMLSVIAEEWDIPLRSQGSTTFHNEALGRGVEPDECYYIQNEPVVRGRDEIDSETDPPPDLAIEIDISSSSLNRLDIYAALKVPELWRFDGENLSVWVLGADGRYRSSQESSAIPSLFPGDLVAHLARRNELDELAWIREFRNWVRGRSRA